MTNTTDKAIIGNFVRNLLLEGKMTPAEMVQATIEQFPNSQCDEKHIAWYKWDMKRRDTWPKGHKIPSGRKKKTPAPQAKTAPKKAAPKKKRAVTRKKVAKKAA